MVVKTLQVFYGADCLPYKDKEHKVHYPIVTPAFQGSSQVNEIKFYVDDIGVGAQWVACVKLPNGKLGYKLLETSSDELGTYALFTLSSWFTQAKGDLYISLKGYAGGAEIIYDSESEIYKVSGDPIIQSTGAIKLTIQYATPIEESEYPDTFQEILALIYTKLDKGDSKYFKVVDNISNINSAEYADYLKGGDIVYEKTSSIIYVLSGTYPTLTYTNILDIGEIVLTSNVEQFIFGIKRFTGNKTYVNALVSGNDEELATYHYSRLNQDGLTISKTINNANHYFNLRDYNGNWVFRFGEGSNSYYLTIPVEEGTLATQEYVQQEIADALVSAYIVQGSASVSYLNSTFEKTQAHNGYVYNMTDSGTLTNSDSTTISVQAGDNVVFVWNNGSWYFDDLVGIVDLSGYVQKTQTIAGITLANNISAQDLTDALVFMNNTTDLDYVMED